MKVLRIDHIHYKTSEIEKVVPIFEKLLGAEPIMDADFEDEHGIHDVIFGLPNAVQITQVCNPNIAEGKIYSKVPNGIYGFALHVEDINEAAAEMEEMGGKLLYENDFGVVLEKVYTMDTLGLIIEINQYDDAIMSGEAQDEVIQEVKDNAKEHG